MRVVVLESSKEELSSNHHLIFFPVGPWLFSLRSREGLVIAIDLATLAPNVDYWLLAHERVRLIYSPHR